MVDDALNGLEGLGVMEKDVCSEFTGIDGGLNGTRGSGTKGVVVLHGPHTRSETGHTIPAIRNPVRPFG